MATRISKQFTFDAAHQLPHHGGKCARLHGHTYRVEIILRGAVWPMDGSSHEGMIVDFDELTRVYKYEIDQLVDHRFLVPHNQIAVTESQLHDTTMASFMIGDSHYTLPMSNIALLPIDNTTAECLAKWILNVMHACFNFTCAVRVWETPTSYAEAEILYNG